MKPSGEWLTPDTLLREAPLRISGRFAKQTELLTSATEQINERRPNSWDAFLHFIFAFFSRVGTIHSRISAKSFSADSLPQS